MLEQQQTISFSDYSSLYDLIIPKDNLLRQITDLVDFSFVYQELQDKYCHDNGRTAESPIRMFKYLLLKVIYDISDVDVVERTRYDMSFKYFLGLTPEETNLINPSSLTKFRRLRLKNMDLLDLLIKKTVSIAIEAGVLKSRTIIVDATHTHSRSNPISAAKSLEYYCKAVIKVVNSVDDSMELPELPKEKKYSSIMTAAKTIVATVEADAATANMPAVKERLNMLKETISDAETRGVISKDEDARTGHKTAHSSFFGYKTHIAMSDERIITAATVTSGEKGDGQQLPELIKKTEEAGMEVDSIVADKAYSSKENLKMAKENNMRLSARLSSVIDGNRTNKLPFEYNKDADLYVCPAGHLAKWKEMNNRKNDKRHRNSSITYYFDVDKCKVCPLREGCYKEGAKTKTYAITIKSDEQLEQIEYQKTEEFINLQRKRYKIEAKNSELKNVLGYDRALSYGLSCMEMQGALTIFAANVKRIIKLMQNAYKNLLHQFLCIFIHSTSIIFNAKTESGSINVTRNTDHSPAFSSFKTMKDRILHKWLNKQFTAWPFAVFFLKFNLVVKHIHKPELLQI